jgi:hypothetical protein
MCVRAQRVDFADFSGLRPGSCSVSAAAREASFSDVLGAQLVAKVRTSQLCQIHVGFVYREHAFVCALQSKEI